MKIIGIITAMGLEADYIIKNYKLQQKEKKVGLKIFSGEYNNNQIILVVCGIGKIFSTIGTTYLFENYNLDKIINIGLAGGISNNKTINIGDVFLPNIFIQHDFFIPLIGIQDKKLHEKITISTLNNTLISNDFTVIKGGICLTGDQFIEDKNTVKTLQDNHNGDLVEMEAYCVASVAREYDALDKIIVIKGICDNGTKTAGNDLKQNLDLAMKNSLIILEKAFN